MDKTTERKNELDKVTYRSLQDECDRMAEYYDRNGFQKQAKKLRLFKKQVRQLVGSL